MKKITYLPLLLLFASFSMFSIAEMVSAADISISWTKPNYAFADSNQDEIGDWVDAGTFKTNFTHDQTLNWSYSLKLPDVTTKTYDSLWQAVASDSSGSTLVTAAYGGRIYLKKSTLWEELTPAGANNRNWSSIDISFNGGVIVASISPGFIYVGKYGGDGLMHWTHNYSYRNWTSVACNNDCTKLIASAMNDYIYTSIDGGDTWIQQTTLGNKGWQSVASDFTGSHLIAASLGGGLYIGDGYTWTEQLPSGENNQPWKSVASNSSGDYLIVAANGGSLYIGKLTGVNNSYTWTKQNFVLDSNGTPKLENEWSSVAITADGNTVFATIDGYYIFSGHNRDDHQTYSWTPEYPVTNPSVPGGWNSVIDPVEIEINKTSWTNIATNSNGTNIIVSAYRYDEETDGLTCDVGSTVGSKVYTGSIGSGWKKEDIYRSVFNAFSESLTLKMVYPSKMIAGKYFEGKTIYNRAFVAHLDNCRILKVSGTIYATGCDNSADIPLTFFIQDSAPPEYNCDEPIIGGDLVRDQLCVGYAVDDTKAYSDCLSDDDYYSQDGVCIKPTTTMATTNGGCSSTTAKKWPFDATNYGNNPIFCLSGTSPTSQPSFPRLSSPIETWTCPGITKTVTCTASVPYCGDNIKDANEECDGTDDNSCPTGCSNLCKCPVCGNNVREGTEECDGTATGTACDGKCSLLITTTNESGIIPQTYSDKITPWDVINRGDPFASDALKARVQFIVKKEELTALGFKKFDKITGISFDLAQPIEQYSFTDSTNLIIRMKPTTATTVTTWESGWTNSYTFNNLNNGFPLNVYGWNKFNFSGDGFIWDGNNIMFDVSHTIIFYAQNQPGGELYLVHDEAQTDKLLLGGYCSNGCNLLNYNSGTNNGVLSSYVPHIELFRISTVENSSCKCPVNIPTLSALKVDTINCLSLGASSMKFSWVYSNADPQTGYQIQITSDPNNFSADGTCTDCEATNGNGTSGNAETAYFDVVVDHGETTIDNKLHFSYRTSYPTYPIQYYWRVRVSDANHGLDSATWYYGGSSTTKPGLSFTTPLHPYPYASFAPKVSPVTLTATYANSVFYDSSICFKNNGDQYNCACALSTDTCNSTQRNNTTYKWWFKNTSTNWLTYVGANNPDSTAKPSLELVNKTAAYWAYNDPGIYIPVLQVCDSTTPTPYCCYGLSDIVIKSPGTVPIWREVSPLE